MASARPGSLRERAFDALRFHPREAAALGVLAALLIAGAGIAAWRARPVPAAALAPIGSPSVDVTPTVRVVVHVVGAVRKPGVYTFAGGARVVDAIRAAGGFARGADRAAVNLARLLVDGEQLAVPKAGEKPPPSSSGGGGASAGGKVNINTATVADFDTLPGIGPVLAQRIFDYREQHGPFRDVRDLMKVTGIGPSKFDALKDFVTV